ncbi:B12-binding domain-containing radical SAM protein [Desulfosarcina sp.]|uniref:B12-binding domain-containing radical SAM protein n=1 Tax=Desulfosarcina sp. TaxID=2027861 RepID=UPI00397072E8
MRVLLINPFYPISETPSPPLGLAFLAGALERAGIEVQLLDCVVFPFSPDLLSPLIRDFKPDLAGATAVTMTVDHALAVLDQIKALNPSITTILGGPHATFCSADILQSCNQVDVVACGEGENTLVALARAIETGAGLACVPGIAFRDGGQIITTAMPPLAHIDELAPPSRHLIPLGRYRALGMPVSMTTSRGCPFKCIFCVGRKMVGARVRYRDPMQVVDEMTHLNTLGFHQINLADDLFTANESHCLAVCNEILDRGLKIKWTSFARVDTVSRRMLKTMRHAGCTTVSFGVESGCVEMLQRIKKGITLEQVIQAVQLCLDCGIDPHASFILGLPGETPETLAQTLKFGEQLKTMGVSHGFHILAPFPGTDVRERIDEYDLQILSDDWRRYHANRAIIRTAGVAPETMDAIVIDGEQRFDQWLGEIDRLRKAGRATDEQAWPLVRLEHTVVLYDLMMKRLIEEKCVWRADRSDKQDTHPVEKLIRRVSGDLDHPFERIRAAIAFAAANHYLTHTTADGQVRWSWVNYL